MSPPQIREKAMPPSPSASPVRGCPPHHQLPLSGDAPLTISFPCPVTMKEGFCRVVGTGG